VACRRGSPRRDKLIGFGDPYFNEQQAADAEQQAVGETLQLASTPAAATRGVSFRTRALARTADVDTTELALLPRLPDTRLELIAMARALDVDPAKALFLGRDANERNVETIDLSSDEPRIGSGQSRDRGRAGAKHAADPGAGRRRQDAQQRRAAGEL
jgi:hypothetical protein